jgi:hypothetical protein
MATLDTVTKILAVFGEVHSVELTETLVKVYHVVLEDIDDQILQAAGWQLLAESKWFPKPAELREKALSLKTTPHLLPDEAWGLVMRRAETYGAYYPPEFDDPIVQEAAVLTGWREICHTDYEQLPFVRKRFDQIYQQLVDRAANEQKMLPETTRRISGSLTIGQTVERLLQAGEITAQISGSMTIGQAVKKQQSGGNDGDVS